MESAFLKDNTDVYDVSFQTDKSIKIKIEVDTQPRWISGLSKSCFYSLTLSWDAVSLCRISIPFSTASDMGNTFQKFQSLSFITVQSSLER